MSTQEVVPQTNKDVKDVLHGPRTESGIQLKLPFPREDQEGDKFSEHLPLPPQSSGELEHLETFRLVRLLERDLRLFRALSHHDVVSLHRLGAVGEALSALTRLEGSLRHVAGAAAAGSRLSSRQAQRVTRLGGTE